MQLGLSKPTQHKPIITQNDLQNISAYLMSDSNPDSNPDIGCGMICPFGLEFHQQLSRNSFQFLTDDDGIEYVALSHETKQKNWQGGLDHQEAPHDKRMYATGDARCPVASLRELLERTPAEATSLFNHCSKEALASPQTVNIWYAAKPCKQHQFSKFMPDVSRNSGCSRKYTAYCLRSTAIQALNDDGFEIRHIMYMSGHRNEASVRSYARECSTEQKHRLSSALTKVSRPSLPETTVGNDETLSSAESQSPAFPPPLPQAPVPSHWSMNTNQMTSSNRLSSSFISNSTFSNCTFHFGNNPFNSTQ